MDRPLRASLDAIYQFMDCNGDKDGGPVPYPDISQIADFSPAQECHHDKAEPRVKKFYPGVLDSKYMQAVVRGGREGLLQFKENAKPGYPVPYPWPEWFDHESSGSSAGRKRAGQRCGQPTHDGYPKGCVSQKPAQIPDCTDGGAAGQHRVPSMYDPPQRAAVDAAQYAQACPPAAAPPPICEPQMAPPPPQACYAPPPPPQACYSPPPPQQACNQPPPFVRAAQEDACIPCSAAPEVYQNPADPRANCSPQRPPPPPVHAHHQQRPQRGPMPNDKNFVPSYLHEPENMSKIIAHDYQRQWVDERDHWETSHATSNDAQHTRMLNRCQQGERKFVQHQKCARDTKAEVAEGKLPECRVKSTSKRPWYPPGRQCVVRRRCGC